MTPTLAVELLKNSPTVVLAFMVWWELQRMRIDLAKLAVEISTIAAAAVRRLE